MLTPIGASGIVEAEDVRQLQRLRYQAAMQAGQVSLTERCADDDTVTVNAVISSPLIRLEHTLDFRQGCPCGLH